MSTAGRHDDRNRLAIIAGGGSLPLIVASAVRAMGDDPFIVPLAGESSADWGDFDHLELGIGNLMALAKAFRTRHIGRAIMSGSVRRRPSISSIRPTRAALGRLPRILRRLSSGGDNAVLTLAIELLEAEGVAVIGVQDVVPGLLAAPGKLGRYQPRQEDFDDMRVAMAAARQLGALDIGQGAVAVGGRVVALEGPEGTDQMLARVGEMRVAGRISARKPGVLVKLCKPQQDRRVDLPAIGPATLMNAQLAGLAGIAVEAGRSLVLDAGTLTAFADREKMFVYGLDPDKDLAPESSP